MSAPLALFVGDLLACYGFPDGHPLGIDRQGAFWSEALKLGLDKRVQIGAPRLATREELERFHTTEHVSWVKLRSEIGDGYLDYGDTPAFPGVFERGAAVAGTAIEGLERLMAGDVQRTFQPIGGLHHARRGQAAGFCVFNDLGVVIDSLRSRFGVQRIGYVDIDVHHGDGTQSIVAADPDTFYGSTHQYPWYPGTGSAGESSDTVVNVPLEAGSGDEAFVNAWRNTILPATEAFAPAAILVSAGFDAHLDDPLAGLMVTSKGFRAVALEVAKLARRLGLRGVALTLEGGYDVDALRASAGATIEGLLAGLGPAPRRDSRK